MSILFDSSTDAVFRTTNLPVLNGGPYTISLWFYLVTAPTGGDQYQSIIVINTNQATDYDQVGVRESGGNVRLFVAADNGTYHETVGSTNLSINTWYHLLFVRSSTTNLTAYLNGASEAVQTSTGTGQTTTRIDYGLHPQFASDDFKGRIANIKEFLDARALADAVHEQYSFDVVYPANLNAWYPTLINTRNLDFSGSGRNLTEAGTPGDADNPQQFVEFYKILPTRPTGGSVVTASARLVTATRDLPRPSKLGRPISRLTAQDLVRASSRKLAQSRARLQGQSRTETDPRALRRPASRMLSSSRVSSVSRSSARPLSRLLSSASLRSQSTKVARPSARVVSFSRVTSTSRALLRVVSRLVSQSRVSTLFSNLVTAFARLPGLSRVDSISASTKQASARLLSQSDVSSNARKIAQAITRLSSVSRVSSIARLLAGASARLVSADRVKSTFSPFIVAVARLVSFARDRSNSRAQANAHARLVSRERISSFGGVLRQALARIISVGRTSSVPRLLARPAAFLRGLSRLVGSIFVPPSPSDTPIANTTSLGPSANMTSLVSMSSVNSLAGEATTSSPSLPSALLSSTTPTSETESK